ncbi:MAG: hypothetical protein ACYTFV_03710 [Planctomycetota bacterium]
MSRPTAPDAGLTLPGAIPGLLRRSSPLRDPNDGELGVVLRVGEASFCLVGVPAGLYTYTARSLHLDLTDATGRAHAAWWLAGRVGSKAGSAYMHRCAPRWLYSDAGWRAWQIDGIAVACDWTVGRGPVADLNPDDPRTLPDESRRVDAEALRLVCLHVAGL